MATVNDRTFAINRTFMDMMRSNRPLTNREIDRMADRRPELWERFRGMGDDSPRCPDCGALVLRCDCGHLD